MSEMIQVPDGWEFKLSSELCKGIADGTHDTPQPSFFGYKLVTSKNLKDNKLDFEDCYLISEENYIAINKRSQVKQYDILFGMIGTIGNPVIILDKNVDFAIKNVGLFRFNGDYELSKWFYYYLNSEKFQSYLDFVLSGSSQKFVSLGMLRTLPILIPKEKKEQEKIAKILSTLDRAIESTNRLIEKEKNIKTALMQELLTNGIDKNGQIRTKATHSYKESELGLIPDEWEVDFIENHTKIITGDKDTQDRLDDGIYPFYVRSQTIERINTYSFDGEAILTAGDGVGVGKVFHHVNERFDFHQRVYCIHDFSEKLDSTFFFEYFRTYFIEQVNKYSAKGSVDSVRLDMIALMNIPLPSVVEQKQIAKILTTQDKKIETEETNLAKLKELKKGVMNDLLSGKVRVKV